MTAFDNKEYEEEARLGQMYVADEWFRKNIGKHGEGVGLWLRLRIIVPAIYGLQNFSSYTQMRAIPLRKER